jgi:carboxymethylenebutenolidase
MRTYAPLAAALLLALPATAQEWALQRLDASPRHHEWAAIKHGDRTVHTFVA